MSTTLFGHKDVVDNKKDRVCPAFTTAAVRSGKTLRTLGATSEVTIQAPVKLLELALRLCDGTRTINEIVSHLPRSVERDRFDRFLDFLFGAGVLIDGNLLTAHALQYGFQMSPYGASAPAHITDGISRRSADPAQYRNMCIEAVRNAPLIEFYRDRVSTYTFDDIDISAGQLSALLWSLCGIVAPHHERLGNQVARRTIASAGALHLLQVYLALQRPTGKHQPGIYRIHFPDADCIALESLGEQHEMLPRAFAQPWNVQFATGVIFLAADVELAATRYRNRATQYLFMEAGAALHNGSLSASRLNLGFATLGCYYETVVQQLCRLERQIILGSAVFGPKPTRRQTQQLSRAPNLDFAWVDVPSPHFTVPFYLARANHKTSSGAPKHTWGADTTPWNAYRKACAEAVERQGQAEPKDLRNASLLDLKNARSPEQFIRYHRQQYKLAKFPFEPFSPSGSYWWKQGTEYGTAKKVWIHADLIYPRSVLSSTHKITHKPVTYATTSGCAAGTTQEEAFERALFELVERDAFMRCWLAQTPGHPIALGTVPGAVRSRLKALQMAQCEVGIQLLPSPWSKVVLVWAQHKGNRFTTLGTAAHDDMETALLAALTELESRVFVWLNGHHPSRQLRPASVWRTEHHFDLYGCAKYFSKADGMLKTLVKASSFRKLASPASTTQEALQDRFAEQGLSPILVDITPEKCFIDQGRTKLLVVKAFVPSLVPLSFGYQLEPRGMVDFMHADSKFPHPFP